MQVENALLHDQKYFSYIRKPILSKIITKTIGLTSRRRYKCWRNEVATTSGTSLSLSSFHCWQLNDVYDDEDFEATECLVFSFSIPEGGDKCCGLLSWWGYLPLSHVTDWLVWRRPRFWSTHPDPFRTHHPNEHWAKSRSRLNSDTARHRRNGYNCLQNKHYSFLCCFGAWHHPCFCLAPVFARPW